MDESPTERRRRLVRWQRMVGLVTFAVVGLAAFFLFISVIDPEWNTANSLTDGYAFGYLLFGGCMSLVAGFGVAIFSRVWVEIFFDRKVEAARTDERLAARERSAREAADRRRPPSSGTQNEG